MTVAGRFLKLVLRNVCEKQPVLPESGKVMGDRGEIFQTPRSEIFQFRSWIPDERRYYTKTLKTKDRGIALQRAEEEVLRINSSKKLGHSVFGATIKQLCHGWMEEQEKRVEWDLVKPSRIATLKSRLKKWTFTGRLSIAS